MFKIKDISRLKTVDEISIEEVMNPTQDLLVRIGQLRIRAWATQIPQAVSMAQWLDEYEASGCHWLVYKADKLVAAARLSIHQSLCDVPDPECFVGVFPEPLPAPIASFNRLVVDPSARGLGLARRLDELRLAYAELHGCRCVIGSTPSGQHRIRQLEDVGFTVVGLGNPDLKPPCSFGPRPLVILCRLPRNQLNTEKS